jgi:vacuolar protein sorting-associated protein 13A/C
VQKCFLQIPNYEGQSWKSDIKITKDTPELSPWLFTSEDMKENSMFLGIHKDVSDEIVTLHLYCPFWMINRTGLNLAYEVS